MLYMQLRPFVLHAACCLLLYLWVLVEVAAAMAWWVVVMGTHCTHHSMSGWLGRQLFFVVRWLTVG